jgi:O-succinylbenzoate synthase
MLSSIWTARYTLVPRRPPNARSDATPRQGALLRIDDGFADLFPWPELGDATLDEQLALLERDQTTPLTLRSLELASLDGAARRAGRSLFEGLTIPLSHWPGFDPPPGFDTIKVKGGPDFDASSLPGGVRVRIDFNATLDADSFLRMALPAERIDFVEDPCPYDGPTWRALGERKGIRLALDREVATEGVDILVIKPALQAMPDVDRELVVTSYMDHPVGQFGAAYVAALHALRVNARCGLFTHVLYEPNEFIERIRSDGPRLLAPEGTGIGFDDLLERLPWKRLR